MKLTAEKAELDLEAAGRDFRVARIQRELKENLRDLAAQKVERHQVLAPLSGMVVEIHRQRGEWVEPGDKVLRIVRLDRLRAEGFVDANAPGPTGWAKPSCSPRRWRRTRPSSSGQDRIRQPRDRSGQRAGGGVGRGRQPRVAAAAGIAGDDDDRSRGRPHGPRS